MLVAASSRVRRALCVRTFRIPAAAPDDISNSRVRPALIRLGTPTAGSGVRALRRRQRQVHLEARLTTPRLQYQRARQCRTDDDERIRHHPACNDECTWDRRDPWRLCKYCTCDERMRALIDDLRVNFFSLYFSSSLSPLSSPLPIAFTLAPPFPLAPR